jgi:uncharacterized membrane protein
MPQESHLHSVSTAATHRVAGTITMIAIVYVIEDEVVTAMAVGRTEPPAEMIVYYVHERVRPRVPLGTIPRRPSRRSRSNRR